MNHCTASCHFLFSPPRSPPPHPSPRLPLQLPTPPPLGLSSKSSSSFLFTPRSSLQCSLVLSLPPSLSPSALPSSQHLINICLGFHSLSACRHLHTHTHTRAPTHSIFSHGLMHRVSCRGRWKTKKQKGAEKNSPEPPFNCVYLPFLCVRMCVLRASLSVRVCVRAPATVRMRDKAS